MSKLEADCEKVRKISKLELDLEKAKMQRNHLAESMRLLKKDFKDKEATIRMLQESNQDEERKVSGLKER
eukprot:10077211-Ditylum_brightwellii.AAC.1